MSDISQFWMGPFCKDIRRKFLTCGQVIWDSFEWDTFVKAIRRKLLTLRTSDTSQLWMGHFCPFYIQCLQHFCEGLRNEANSVLHEWYVLVLNGDISGMFWKEFKRKLIFYQTRGTGQFWTEHFLNWDIVFLSVYLL